MYQYVSNCVFRAERPKIFAILTIFTNFRWFDVQNNHSDITNYLSFLKLIEPHQFKEMLLFEDHLEDIVIADLLTFIYHFAMYETIHIVSYCKSSFNYEQSIDKIARSLALYWNIPYAQLRKNVSERIRYVPNEPLNFTFLEDYINENGDDQYYMVIGINRLVKDKPSDEVVHFISGELNIQHVDNKDWESFVWESSQ